MLEKKKKTKAVKQKTQTLSKAQLINAWHNMALIRRFEERCGQIYAMGEIGGFCHLYIGQEAVVVGLQAVAKSGDQIITAYRDHCPYAGLRPWTPSALWPN